MMQTHEMDMHGKKILRDGTRDLVPTIFGIPPERPTPNIPRSSAGRLFRRQGARPRTRGDAPGPDPLWGQGHQDRLLDHQMPQAEEVDTKPAFREAFRQRRCLVPLRSR